MSRGTRHRSTVIAVVATLVAACSASSTETSSTVSILDPSTSTSSAPTTTRPSPIVGSKCPKVGAIDGELQCRLASSGRIWMSSTAPAPRPDSFGPDEPCRLPDQRVNPRSAEVGQVVGFPRELSGVLTPSVGELRLAAVAVDFPDYPGTTGELDVPPDVASDVDEWLRVESGGRLRATWQIHDEWITLSKPAAEYRVQGFGVEPYQEISTEIVDRALEVLALEGIDELFVYFPDSLTRSELGSSINPFEGVLAQIGIPKREIDRYEGSRIRNMKGAGTMSQVNGNTLWAIWAHALLHAMGLQVHGPEPTSLIDSASNGLFTVSSWTRWLLNWLDESEVACLAPEFLPAEVDLVPLQADSALSGVRMAMIPIDETTAIAVESHRAVGYGAALGPEGTYGILAYLIDTKNQAEYDPFTNDESAGTRFLYPDSLIAGARRDYGMAAFKENPMQPLMMVGDTARFGDHVVEYVSSSGIDTVRIRTGS